MRSARLLAALILLAACAPPPPIATGDSGLQEPSITVVYPPSGTVVALAADCTLSFTVVVDIENFELVTIDDEPDPVDDKGHWHFETGDDYQSAYKEWLELEPIVAGSDTTRFFELTLHDSAHGLIDSSAATANLEIQVAPDEAATCP